MLDQIHILYFYSTMTKQSPDNRITVQLTQQNWDYLATLVEANESDKTNVVNDLFRLVRGLGAVGIRDLATISRPGSKNPTTYILPLALADPAFAANVLDQQAEVPGEIER